MKPSWNDPSCPPWAKWLAMDRDGDWYWYETEPEPDTDEWAGQWVNGSNYEPAGHTEWTDTLEPRPEVSE